MSPPYWSRTPARCISGKLSLSLAACKAGCLNASFFGLPVNSYLRWAFDPFVHKVQGVSVDILDRMIHKTLRLLHKSWFPLTGQLWVVLHQLLCIQNFQYWHLSTKFEHLRSALSSNLPFGRLFARLFFSKLRPTVSSNRFSLLFWPFRIEIHGSPV